MSLRKRIAKLELLEKQNSCNHTFVDITINGRVGESFWIGAECHCGKVISRCIIGKEVDNAYKVLSDELLKGQ